MIAVPAALHVVACGGGDSAPDASLGASSFQASSADSSGHTHQLTIQCMDLSRSTVTYTSGEGGGHTHQVTVNGTQLAALANGDTVTITVSTPHAHTWMMTKPASAC